MTALLLLALALAVVSSVLAVRSLTMDRLRTARTVSRIGEYGFELAQPESELAKPSPFDRLAGGLLRRVEHRLRGGREDEIRALLQGAGLYRTTPARYLTYRVLGAFITAVGALFAVRAVALAPLFELALVAFLVAFAWLLPPVELKRRRDVRLARIDRSLTDLVDFLVVTIEAGVGLSAALAAAARRFRAPLGDELRLAAQEQAMGLSTDEALRNLLARCETPMVRSFVRSIVQGETLGVSIGQILRGLAVEMRKRRRQAAEEQAHKAPVKMLFPLVFLIFPALFLILLGPAAYDVLRVFGGE